MKKVKCFICGTEFEGGAFDDCPVCDWTYVGYESELDENEKEDANLMSIAEAKRLFAQGKNIWGEPLPKKK